MTALTIGSGVPVATRTVRTLEILFVISGFCGLIYESIWSHYLKLFLGHAAYAQSIVLVVFIGGMAFGAWAAGRFSSRIGHPLLAYAAVEMAVGLGSLLFHGAYVRVTDWTLERVLPWACSAGTFCAVQWVTAALLILPQSILLGTTFPLMTAAIIRIAPQSPGRRIASLYFYNSIGAVFGVLCSGFYLIPTVGLPGTLMTAGLMNVAVAITVYFVAKGAADGIPLRSVAGGIEGVSQVRVLLLVAGITGLSSFVYEIVWIRMLSLVIGASTQAFEIMLAAFILGLALGGYWVRSRIDRYVHLVRTLAIVQILMGILAVATLPLYDATFDFLAWVMRALSPSEGGYTLYNVTSQGIAMAVMLPATVLAGMTLPLITFSLIRSGFGERAIGYVYAANTVGAIIGVVVAVHLALPLLGVKAALLFAASIDIALGAWLLARYVPSSRPAGTAGWIAAGVLVVATTATFFDLPPERTASGVFRHGHSRLSADKEMLFHRDGKTATVAVFRDRERRVMIATNGKIDAAIGADDAEPAKDELTMAIAGILPLLYRPEMKKAAVIGFGSGMTTATLLASPILERVDTIEIESEMISGARHFGDRFARAFTDPRSRIIVDDAKSFFARGREQYDAIVSEPSNPWVSGVASLFTVEFYRRIKQYLTDDGLLVQWVQTYEITDALVASILRALAMEFADYAVYSPQPGDLIVVASKKGLAERLQSTALAFPGLKREIARLGFESIDEFNVRRLAGRPTLDAFLSQQGHALNSDYYPIVDTQAPRARFLRAQAQALDQLAVAPVPLVEMLEDAPAQNVPSRFPANGSNAGRRAEVVEAQMIARWLVDGSPPARKPMEVTTLSRNAALVRAQVWSCAPAAPNVDLLESLSMVAGQLNPSLSRSEVAHVWAAVEGAPCYARLSAREKRWVELFRAVGARSASSMAAIGADLLSTDSALSTDLREYALLAAATGLVKLGQSSEARALLDKNLAKLPAERRSLPWLLTIRGKTLKGSS